MAKGSDFEREICKQLSLWWTNQERDDVFWRTAGSGARHTVRKKAGKTTANQEGDICATDPIGQPLIDILTIELKKGYNSWNLKEILDTEKKNKTIVDFWRQCIREQEGRNCQGWWLITRQDRKHKLLFFNDGFYRLYRENNNLPSEYIRVTWESQYIYCLAFDQFLAETDPASLILNKGEK